MQIRIKGLLQLTNRINFNINNVSINSNGFGEAVLRVGVGRDHGKSLKPTQVKNNNTTIEVPENWRGSDRKGRDSFFGVLEIPVPYNLLVANNTVSVTFSDEGGTCKQSYLQVFNFSKIMLTEAKKFSDQEHQF